MAELTISSDEIRGALERYVSSYIPDISREEVGIVTEAGDGIARVEGLPSTMANELLEFADGTLGVSLNLDVGEIAHEEFRELELQAPNVMARQPVKEPLQTGIKAIDAMTAIGRGQRQLILGDRKTGKTTIALDTILNQRDNWLSGDPKLQVRCIYVAIGQKGSTIAAIKGVLEEHGALEYTTIVASPASDPAGFKYLAPYAGSAIGQHWMYAGKHVLIVFDDLSKQAEAYRAVSLLLRRPPGREAYPGDVFYLHSRLLERCAKLNEKNGSGSLTALPVIETQAGDVSAYIPTNVISITDGQIFLEAKLFYSGVRPAINVGISVSRVGGNAQVNPMRKVAGRLKLELSQYRDLEAFAQFGSDLDIETQRTLARGERLVTTLNQSERSPLDIEDQVVQVFAATNGFVDRISTERVPEFLSGLTQRMHSEGADTLAKIREGDWSDETQEAVRNAVAGFADDFGYDLDEEGQPLEDRQVGETTREQEGIRARAAEGNGSGGGEAEAEEEKE